MPSLTLTPLSTDAPDAPPRSQQQHALSLLLESALPGVQPCTIKLRYEQRCVATNAARPRAATALVTPPAGWRMQLCLLAGIPRVLQAASSRLRSCWGSSGKLGRRRDVRALVRRSRTQPRWESPQRRRLCVSIRAAPLGRARRGASSSALLTRHAIGQRIPGSRFAGAAPSCRQRPTPSARWRRPSSSSHTCPPCVGRRPLSRSPRTKHQ